MNRDAIRAGDKRAGEVEPWQRIKLDRQIVAIGRVAGAKAIYTNDKPLGRFAASAGMAVIGVHDLPLPASTSQPDMLKQLEARAALDRLEDEPKADEIEPDDTEAETPAPEEG